MLLVIGQDHGDAGANTAVEAAEDQPADARADAGSQDLFRSDKVHARDFAIGCTRQEPPRWNTTSAPVTAATTESCR